MNVDPLELQLLCARFWPDRHGGVESRMWEVSRRLAQRGTLVWAITENRIGAEPEEALMPGLTVQRYETFRPGVLWRWERYARIGWWRHVLSRQPRSGAIWATDPIQAVAAISLGMRDRLIYNPACCVAAMRRVGDAYPYAHTMQLPGPLAWLDGIAYRKAKAVIVSSQNVREQLASAYGRGRTERDDVYVVPHGAATTEAYIDRESARRALDLPDDGFVVGFVGRLDPCKDLGFLFAAAQHCLRANDRILIVGDGPDRDRLHHLACKHQVDGRIVWAGRLDPPSQAYAAMDVLALPSIYEAFGNVLPEAMAARVPVIGRRRDAASRTPVLTASEEIIEHHVNGLVVDAHDPADLADQLNLLRELPVYAAKLGRQAQRRAEAWSWDHTVTAYESLIRELVPQAVAQGDHTTRRAA